MEAHGPPGGGLVVNDDPIPRFSVPTLDDLRPLLAKDVTEATLETARSVLAKEVEPVAVSPRCA